MEQAPPNPIESKPPASRENQPLTIGEIIWTAILGVLGLIGLVFQFLQARRFKSDGQMVKYKKSWRIFWFYFFSALAIKILITVVAIATS